MRDPTIARNYAGALFQLGERTGESELFGDLIEGVTIIALVFALLFKLI